MTWRRAPGISVTACIAPRAWAPRSPWPTSKQELGPARCETVGRVPSRTRTFPATGSKRTHPSSFCTLPPRFQALPGRERPLLTPLHEATGTARHAQLQMLEHRAPSFFTRRRATKAGQNSAARSLLTLPSNPRHPTSSRRHGRRCLARCSFRVMGLRKTAP